MLYVSSVFVQTFYRWHSFWRSSDRLYFNDRLWFFWAGLTGCKQDDWAVAEPAREVASHRKTERQAGPQRSQSIRGRLRFFWRVSEKIEVPEASIETAFEEGEQAGRERSEHQMYSSKVAQLQIWNKRLRKAAQSIDKAMHSARNLRVLPTSLWHCSPLQKNIPSSRCHWASTVPIRISKGIGL